MALSYDLPFVAIADFLVLWVFFDEEKFLLLTHIIGVQAGLYHYIIRHKVPERTRRGGASWYLKIISLFNFSMWTISVVDGNKGMQQYINTLLDGGFGSVLSAVYAALIIDYRLLCCFLFAELAFKVGCF